MINILLQVSILDELIKKNLKGSTILNSMPFLLVKGAFPPLIALYGISSHGDGLSIVQLVSNLGKELMDWLFKNYIDALPHLIFTIPSTFPMVELAIAPKQSPYNSPCLPDIII